MPEDKLTVKDIVSEYGINIKTANKIFNDKDLPVQAYCRPRFVLRSELLKYFSKRHDNLQRDTE